MGNRPKLSLPLVVLLTLSSHPSLAGPARYTPIFDCDLAYRKLLSPTQDSSVEVEMGMLPQVARLFTTVDGKISGLLGDKKLTAELIKELTVKWPEYQGRVADIPWDRLDQSTQKQLVEFAHQGQSFWDSREIQGLVPKERINAQLPRAMTLFGIKYPAGTVSIPLRKIFGSQQIHFIGPSAVENFHGIEAHVRQKQVPSQNLKDTWNLMSALGIKPSPVHQHVVGSFPVQDLKNESVLETTRLIDYHRRLNLYTEMLRIFEGHPIEKIQGEGTSVNFDSLSAGTLLGQFYNYFRLIHMGEADYPISRELSYVALRAPYTYKSEKPLIGFEFRTLSPNSSPETQEKLSRLMDSTQSSLETRNFGVPKEKIHRWIGRLTDRKLNPNAREPNAGEMDKFEVVKEEIEKLYYSEKISRSFLRKIFADQPDTAIRLESALAAETTRNKAIPILTHDWSRDPLLFENPETQAKILEIQVQALKRVNGGEKPDDALKFFIKKSGLFNILERSLGV